MPTCDACDLPRERGTKFCQTHYGHAIERVRIAMGKPEPKRAAVRKHTTPKPPTPPPAPRANAEDRASVLARLVHARGRMTRAELAHELDVSARTLQRSVSIAVDAGWVLISRGGRRGGIVPGPTAPPINREEVAACP